MAKKVNNKYRVMVSVTPELYALLEQISKLAGASMGGLCGELLEDAKPAFQAMAKALELARENNTDAFDVLTRLLAQAQSEAAGIQLDMLDTKTSLRRAPTVKGSEHENGQD